MLFDVFINTATDYSFHASTLSGTVPPSNVGLKILTISISIFKISTEHTTFVNILYNLLLKRRHLTFFQ